jgi:hypothetical protein
MANKQGPWWTNTWWGKKTATVNLSLVALLLLILVWKVLTR